MASSGSSAGGSLGRLARPEESAVFLAGPQQPEKKGLIQEEAGWPARESGSLQSAPWLAFLPALNFHCLQPCDSGLPDLGACQPCTAAGTSSDPTACNWDRPAC